MSRLRLSAGEQKLPQRGRLFLLEIERTHFQYVYEGEIAQPRIVQLERVLRVVGVDDGQAAQRNQQLTIAMAASGSALLVTGAVLVAVGIERRRSARAEATTTASLRVAPSWSPDGVGLTLRGSF